MNVEHSNKATHRPVNLNNESTIPEILELLRSGRDESEIAAIVLEIDAQGRNLFGEGFSLRLDSTSQAKDIARRVFITRPGI